MKRQYWLEVRVPIDIEKDDEGMFIATSPLIRGLLATANSEHAAKEGAVKAVQDLGVASAINPPR